MQKILASPAALVAALALAACGQPPTRGASSATASDALADTMASATQAAGTMLCAPSPAQLDACAGLGTGDACAMTSPDGLASVAGTCRATLDGTAVACGPTPPAPPAPLVAACAGLASGDACTVTEPDGDAHDGTCVTARDGSTLVCGRAFAPPPPAIEACAALAVGDACTLTRLDGTAVAGVCGLGPAGTGVLACVPPQALRPSATTACAGLAAGAACTVGSPMHPVSGTCVTPTAGGDPVCQAPCPAFGGAFRWGPGPVRPPPGCVDACVGLAAGDACTFTRLDGSTVAGTCRLGPDGAGPLACAPMMMPGPGPR
jgi:hypothetical protein